MNYKGIFERSLRALFRSPSPFNTRICEHSVSADGIMRSPYGSMEFPNARFHECFYEQIEKFGKKTALECSMTGRKYTYAQLRKFSGILASSLQNKLKLQKGDFVALFLPNVPEYPMIFLAGSECGVITTPVNSNYTYGELARQIQISNAKAVFTTVEKYNLVETALKSIQKTVPIIVIKEKSNSTVPSGAANFTELLDASTCGELKRVDGTNDDVVILPFSSGTTGLPKGVELMHKNIVANIMQIVHSKKRIITEDLKKEIVLGILPIFHIYGMVVVTFVTLFTGGFVVTVPNFEPRHFIETILRKKVKSLYLVPPLILFISNTNAITPRMLKNVRHVVNGASPIGHTDIEKFLEKGKHIIFGQGYGLTETSPVVLLYTKERAHKYGGTGVPLISTEVKLAHTETMKPVGVKEVGEIWVRGPQVMKGYYNSPKETEEIFSDGWLRTGDLAYYDDDGDFFIRDRIKELIKVKGFQVAPAELEEILRAHPKVVDAAVIGVNHPMKGEVPKAFITIKKGETATEEEIKNYVKGKVAKYKELEGGVTFMESIPKSSSGKILKNELKQMKPS